MSPWGYPAGTGRRNGSWRFGGNSLWRICPGKEGKKWIASKTVLLIIYYLLLSIIYVVYVYVFSFFAGIGYTPLKKNRWSSFGEHVKWFVFNRRHWRFRESASKNPRGKPNSLTVSTSRRKPRPAPKDMKSFLAIPEACN